MKQETAELAAPASKAFVYAAATTSFLGYSLQEWVYITAIALALLQITFMLVKGAFKVADWLKGRRKG